jgi:hypothetical protein
LIFNNSPHFIGRSDNNDIVINAAGATTTTGNLIFKSGTSSSQSELFKVSRDGVIWNSSLSASEILASDASKNIVSTGTPSSYLTGLTGNIQDQLDDKTTYYEFSDRDTDPGPLGISMGPVAGQPQFMKINNNCDSAATSRFLDISMPSDTTNNQHSTITFFNNSLGSGLKSIQVIGTNPDVPTLRKTFINLSAGTQPNYFLENNVGIDTFSPQEKLHVNGNIRCDNLTANTVLTADANDNIVSSSVSTTMLGYLDATSSIQGQLDNKQNIVAGVSDTEIGYLDGTTSNIQDQLNTKPPVYMFSGTDPFQITSPKIICGSTTTRTTTDPETVSFGGSNFSFTNGDTYTVVATIRMTTNDSNRRSVYIINKLATSFQYRTISTSPSEDVIDWIAIGY